MSRYSLGNKQKKSLHNDLIIEKNCSYKAQKDGVHQIEKKNEKEGNNNNKNN